MSVILDRQRKILLEEINEPEDAEGIDDVVPEQRLVVLHLGHPMTSLIFSQNSKARTFSFTSSMVLSELFAVISR